MPSTHASTRGRHALLPLLRLLRHAPKRLERARANRPIVDGGLHPRLKRALRRDPVRLGQFRRPEPAGRDRREDALALEFRGGEVASRLNVRYLRGPDVVS